MNELRIVADQIGFDFDGVIADIGEAFQRLAGEEHNYQVNLDDITSFQVETCTDIPESVVNKIFEDILNDSLTTRLRPLPGALEVLSEISNISRIRIITARSLAGPVIDWLEYYLPPQVCRQIDLIAMHDHDQKVRFIKEHDLLFFVDDRAETCAQIAAANLHPLLYRQPWNSGWHDFTVVDNWRQLGDSIMKNDAL